MSGFYVPKEISGETLQKSKDTDYSKIDTSKPLDFSRHDDKSGNHEKLDTSKPLDFLSKRHDDGIKIDTSKPLDYRKVETSEKKLRDLVPPLPDENRPDKLEKFEVKPDLDSKHPDIPDDAIKTLADFKTPQVYYNETETQKGEPIQNKIDGLRREDEVEEELKKKYPESEGYEVISEAYLRDKDGNIVKDPVSGEARRIDFVVVKDGKVVDSVEVTSKTADKTEQTAKENRIRENGGNYIRDSNGNLVEIPNHVHTRIERRD